MFRKRSDEALWRLQEELLAAEEEDLEEEYPQDDLDPGDLEADPEERSEEGEADYEEFFDSDYEEEYEQETFCRNAANSDGKNVRNYANRYGRGSPKRFDDDDFFDEAAFADEDVLYRRDYRKAQRKKRRKKLGLLILALLELAAIIWLILWWTEWML